MTQQTDSLSRDPIEAARLIASAPEDDVPAGLWPRQLADLVDVLLAHFQARGRPPREALREAREIVLEMARYMGGLQFYLPTAHRLEVALMQASLYHEYRCGVPCDTLALRYGVTVRHAERIVARQAQMRFLRRQQPLFPDIDPATIAP